MTPDFLDEWRARIAPALDEALAFLAMQKKLPWSDGRLGQWIRQLERFDFLARHAEDITALLRKHDPWLQEAGLRLAIPFSQQVRKVTPEMKRALADLAGSTELDRWVLRALVAFLWNHGTEEPLIEVYEALLQRTAPLQTTIMRAMGIFPEQELFEHYESLIVGFPHPTKTGQLVLPVVEARLGTKGWGETRKALLKRLGYD